MAKFDSKTINFGRVEYTTSTVHVYSSAQEEEGCAFRVEQFWMPGG